MFLFVCLSAVLARAKNELVQLKYELASIKSAHQALNCKSRFSDSLS